MDRKERQKHRASINGHFYNHEVSYNSIHVIENNVCVSNNATQFNLPLK